ncbi:MAG: twin-arginine translocase TatA/TatE family subunit [Gemmatimonadetes bacterium]|nr:twin-arginine translocase TatA/TatE family subunit [Gemmatimonadota bacterium]MCK5482058.1 twin-arginine translocase TatA/TatE family subunit [Gemmatimonadota bacterium]
MFGSLGMWEMLIILFIVMLLFGARRLPEIGGSLGKGIREFKGSLKEVESELKELGGSDATNDSVQQEENQKEAQPRV